MLYDALDALADAMVTFSLDDTTIGQGHTIPPKLRWVDAQGPVPEDGADDISVKQFRSFWFEPETQEELDVTLGGAAGTPSVEDFEFDIVIGYSGAKSHRLRAECMAFDDAARIVFEIRCAFANGSIVWPNTNSFQAMECAPTGGASIERSTEREKSGFLIRIPYLLKYQRNIS